MQWEKQSVAVERTLSIIKPDAVAKNVIGQIYSRFEAAGLKIVAARMTHLSREQAEGFYAVHRERPFFADLVKFMTSGPGDDPGAGGRQRHPEESRPDGRNRSEEGGPGHASAPTSPQSIDANAVHGSDGPATAAIEIAYFFAGRLHSR